MAESAESGGALAWRVLAALEAGALLAGGAALLLHRWKLAAIATVRARPRDAAKTVLITNTTSRLGANLVQVLESHGCRVTSLASETSEASPLSETSAASETSPTSETGPEGETSPLSETSPASATSPASETSPANETGPEGETSPLSEASPESEKSQASEASEQVDALVVIGASPKDEGLAGLAELVTKDVYDNLKVLESQICRVRRGGRVVWAACTGDATSGAFSAAYEAFDSVLRTQLEFIAKGAECEAVWVGRCSSAERAAHLVTAAMLPSNTSSVRNFAVRLRGHLGKWLEIIS